MTGTPRAPISGRGRGSTRGWIVLAAIYVGLIFFVSSRPYLYAPGPDFQLKDKLAHAAEYAALGVMLALACKRGSVGSSAVAFLLVVAIGATIGAGDEMFQGTVPGRRRDVTDWIADVIGTAIGTGMVFATARRRARVEEQVQ